MVRPVIHPINFRTAVLTKPFKVAFHLFFWLEEQKW